MKLIISIIVLILLLIYFLKKKNVEKFNSYDSKIYLIPNSLKVKKNLIFNLSKNENNILVFFNHCGPLKNFSITDLKKLKCKTLLFLRANHNRSYWGKREYEKQKYKIFNSYNTYIIPSKNAEMEKINNKHNFKIISFKNLIKDYPNKKEPQTGFIAYHYLKDIYPNINITLVGFDRKHGEADADWYHEKTYELDYYKRNNVNNISL